MKKEAGRGRALWLAGLFLFSAGSLVFCLVAIPPWQSPDEPTHFEYAHLLARDGFSLRPRPDPSLQEEIIVSLARHDFWRRVRISAPAKMPRTFISDPFLCQAPTQIGKNPPGYYLLAALALKLCPGGTLIGEMYWLRSLSALCALLTVGVVFLCAREVFRGGFYLSLAAAGFVAGLPQFAVIGSSVSPDPLTNLLGALFILLFLQRRGGCPRRFSPALPVLLLGLFVSYKFLILLGAYFLVLAAELLRPPIGVSRRPACRTLVCEASALFALYCALLWFAPDLVGIFLGRFRMLAASVAGYLAGTSVHEPGYWRWFGAMLFKSFWLYFGWLRYPAPAALYGAWGGLTVLSLFGAAARLSGGRAEEKEPREAPCRGLGLIAFFAGTVIAAYYAFWGLRGGHTTTQGRHLFLALPAWAIIFVWGLTGLVPFRWRDTVSRVIFLVLPLLAAAAFVGSVWRVYR
jgi:hypothetical protein